jgi:hypothetical protein
MRRLESRAWMAFAVAVVDASGCVLPMIEVVTELLVLSTTAHLPDRLLW